MTELTPFEAAALDGIRDEVEATRGSSTTEREGIFILIDERVDRGILSRVEADRLREHIFQMDAANRFATFGVEAAPADVPALVRSGLDVMSYGYGQETDGDFNALTEDDLWAFPGGTDPDVDTVQSWAPFRVWLPCGQSHPFILRAGSVSKCAACGQSQRYGAH